MKSLSSYALQFYSMRFYHMWSFEFITKIVLEWCSNQCDWRADGLMDALTDGQTTLNFYSCAFGGCYLPDMAILQWYYYTMNKKRLWDDYLHCRSMNVLHVSKMMTNVVISRTEFPPPPFPALQLREHRV